jgi:hypothetical protein
MADDDDDDDRSDSQDSKVPSPSNGRRTPVPPAVNSVSPSLTASWKPKLPNKLIAAAKSAQRDAVDTDDKTSPDSDDDDNGADDEGDGVSPTKEQRIVEPFEPVGSSFSYCFNACLYSLTSFCDVAIELGCTHANCIRRKSRWLERRERQRTG